MEMGKITPAFNNGDEVREWRVPVVAYLVPSAKPLKVVSVYEDEGHLCIDVEEVTNGT